MSLVFKNSLLLLFIILQVSGLVAQNILYEHEFSADAVLLMEGEFKHAMDLNIQTLLQYDTDRLLEPFLTEAGLNPKGQRFENWDGLAGHVGGHYLSALAMNYANTGNKDCNDRLVYMLAELKRCQIANGNGYLGGVSNSRQLWTDVKNGNFQRYWNAWVPWYNVHKTYAGLRDAWLYTNNEQAKEMYLELCDWGIDIISGLSEAQMQQMLDTEFGGMNEVYADAYHLTGDTKYLNAAKRFTHQSIFDSLAAGIDNLNNMHANTQIPKVVGFARIAQLDPLAENYAKAAEFFWETVVNKRSLALGGNSRQEHFPSAAACTDYVTSREGPETCNTYNMLKLTAMLFAMKPEAKYTDYYERALYNHILSSQHPDHGGYVYFTPARPRHYRVYSDVNEAMWCCVGSGMENHGKYNQMIYSHFGTDSLFVNLFIPSELNWSERGLVIEQSSNFPDDASTQLLVQKADGDDLKLFVRHPSWVAEADFQITINGEKLELVSSPGSYVMLNRTLNAGDIIAIDLPMRFTYETLPNVPEYIALLYGPVLMGAKTGTQGLDGLVADAGRWAHIAGGELEALNKAPVLEGNRDSLVTYFKPVESKSLTFTAPELFPDQPEHRSIEWMPFARIHDARYMMYWMSVSREEYEKTIKELEEEEQDELALDRRTVDEVATGEQQPDADHAMEGDKTYTGVHNDEYYRDARNGGYFSYEMSSGRHTGLLLMVRYWGNEWGNRSFDILVDGSIIASENISGKWQLNDFINVEYEIPDHLLADKEMIKVSFRARAGNYAGGVFYLRLLKSEATQSYLDPSFKASSFSVRVRMGEILLDVVNEAYVSTFGLYDISGRLIHTGQFYRSYVIETSSMNKGVYLLQCCNQSSRSYKRIYIY
ncbi:beta-L-arabinofuranosidase domain-containing protein [Roseimarinus sediminis]|uniref:beta-L-arabinofuranosidase domain-containing protein n=1 Tax=Roseimarinus sediminis TaxID=1610899 RepID=UPI003D1F10F2